MPRDRLTPHQQVVYYWLDKWRDLRTWGRSLRHVDLTVSTREYPKRAGTTWPELQKVNVYHQKGLPGMVGMLKTGLHEFAHIVESKDGHGVKWQERYAKSVTEVSGHYVGWNLENLDELCYRAMLKWWRESGAEAAAKRII